MKGRVIRVPEVADLKQAAKDLSYLTHRRENADISEEFPGILDDFGSGEDIAHQSLKSFSSVFERGVCETFIAFAGETAVGLSIVRTSYFPPHAVDPESPYISMFVARPYRRMGLGRLSLQANLDAVREDFGQKAWALIRNTNLPSIAMMTDAGFELQDEAGRKRDGYGLYTFSASSGGDK
jgi:GNAT superfamily N-acetyltransferase